MYVYIYIYIYIYTPSHWHYSIHLAHLQLDSFPIELVSNWAQFKLHSFLMICRRRNNKR